MRVSTEPMDPIAAMLRSWWIIVAAMVVGASALAVIAYLQPPTWTAAATVQYRPGDPTASLTGGGSGLSGTDADRLLNSQQDIVLSDAVIGPAARSLGVERADVRGHVALSRREGSDVLTVSATADAPDSAALLALTVTNAYVDASRSEGVRALNTQAEALTTSITELTVTAAALPPGVDGAADDPQRAAYVSQLAALTQQQRQLTMAATLYPGKITVLRLPEAPTEPSSAGALQGGLVGASLGLVLGMVLAIWRGARRRARPFSRLSSARSPWDPTMLDQRAPAASL